jgi:hypothetical protein
MISNVTNLEREIDELNAIINDDNILPYLITSSMKLKEDTIQKQRKKENRFKAQFYTADLSNYRNSLKDLINIRSNNVSIVKYLVKTIPVVDLITIEEVSQLPIEIMDDMISWLMNLKYGQVTKDQFANWLQPLKPKKMALDISKINVEFDIRNTINVYSLLSVVDGFNVTKEYCSHIKKAFFFNLEDYKIYALSSGVKQLMIHDIDKLKPKIIFFLDKEVSLSDFIIRVINCYAGIIDREGPDIIEENGCKYVNIYYLRKPEKPKQEPIIHDNTPLVKSFLINWIESRTSLELSQPYSAEELYAEYCNLNAKLGRSIDELITSKKFSKDIQEFVVDISTKSKVKYIGEIPMNSIVRTDLTSKHTMCYYIYTGMFPKGTREYKP